MKNKVACRIFPACLLMLLLSQFCLAQSPHSQHSTAEVGTAPAVGQSDITHISAIRSHNTANGSRVTITSNEVLRDYGAYRNGDNFLVLIPGAQLALTEISVRGTGFTDSKVEARGTNLAFSFRLEAGVSP